MRKIFTGVFVRKGRRAKCKLELQLESQIGRELELESKIGRELELSRARELELWDERIYGEVLGMRALG